MENSQSLQECGGQQRRRSRLDRCRNLRAAIREDGPAGDESNAAAVLFLAAGNTLVNPTVVNDATAVDNASYLKGFRAYFQGNAMSRRGNVWGDDEVW